jgi:hypothetical protein
MQRITLKRDLKRTAVVIRSFHGRPQTSAKFVTYDSTVFLVEGIG